jgi:hypothetical protein
LAFILVFTIFFSPRFNLFQNIVITLASIVAGFLVVGMVWFYSYLRHPGDMAGGGKHGEGWGVAPEGQTRD